MRVSPQVPKKPSTPTKKRSAQSAQSPYIVKEEVKPTPNSDIKQEKQEKQKEISKAQQTQLGIPKPPPPFLTLPSKTDKIKILSN